MTAQHPSLAALSAYFLHEIACMRNEYGISFPPVATRSRRSVRPTSTPERPLTIRLPASLRQRTHRYARSRGLQLAGAIRAILSDHLDEVEGDEQLTRAERWQRDQAWATALAIVDGTATEVTWEEIQTAAAAASARARRSRSAH